jgi:aminoglycoside phosphotransferase (APT) family kinase protein
LILTRHNTLLFLLNHGLLSLQDLIEHSVAVRGHSQRNRGFSVTWHNGQGYYVKQHQPDAGPWETRSSVVNEARVLERLGDPEAGYEGIPTFRLYDPQRQALVIDWQPDAMACADVAMVEDTPDPAVAATLGAALAGLHATLARCGLDEDAGLPLSGEPPWVLTFHRLHPLVGEDQSWAQARLVALIQQHDDIMSALAALAAGWPVNQPIHGDMKWQNCLIAAPSDDGAATAPCMFIDWEMTSLGDPLWDLAGLAQSWLKAWQDALPILPDDREEDLAARGATRFTPFNRALAKLWQCYRDRLPDVDDERFAALCGARLIQTLYEDGAGETDLAPGHLLLLQLACNLLLRPSEGARYLLETP